MKNKKLFEIAVMLLTVYSVLIYILEIEFSNTKHSLEGSRYWIWSERFVAIIFTIEYLIRWFYAKNKLRYPFSFMSIIDLMAVLPFYIGFFVDVGALRVIRALRILRIFKLYRHNEALQNCVMGFRRARKELSILGSMAVVFILLSSVAMFECEHDAQPDKFTSIGDAVWWSIITLSTIGYGDLYPITAEGRIIAVITAFFGLGIFGTFVSMVGSSFAIGLQKANNE